MSETKLSAMVAAALAGAIAMTATATPALAQGEVKCYGVAKAGENDCANAAGTHSCAGQATADYDGGEWMTVASEQECTDMGGQLQAFEGVNANVKAEG